MPPDPTKTYLPKWSTGDRWKVSMMTQSVTTAEFRPQYVERVFQYEVVAMPEPHHAHVRIDVTEEGAEEEVWSLSVREVGFSLERVSLRRGAEPEQTLIQNGAHPFIYYERRMPFVPDFPAFPDPTTLVGKREFIVEDGKLLQTTEATANGLKITMVVGDPSGMLHVVMDWKSGDPWWSTIQCQEVPPGGLHGHTVASGYLLQDSIVRASR